MNLLDQMLAAAQTGTLAVRAPRGPRNPDVRAERERQAAVAVADAVESFDADASYLCLCGQPLINWSCGVCDVAKTLKVAA